MTQSLQVAQVAVVPIGDVHLVKSKSQMILGKEICATKYLRRMRGGCQACLIQGSDGAHYVLKVQNNPQGKRVLVNELLGALLAKRLGLPVAEPAVVNISEDFVKASAEMVIQLGRSSTPMQSGRCFGSRVPRDAQQKSLRPSPLEVVHDLLPAKQLMLLGNTTDVAGMLMFDKWTCNTDGRQTIFVQDINTGTYRAIMIDQGFCFNGIAWNFPDSLTRCMALYDSVYDRIPSFSNFEPWFDRLEDAFDRSVLATLAKEIPPEWYEDAPDALRCLLDWLERRRTDVPEMLWFVWRNYRKNFPNRTSRRRCSSNSLQKNSRQLSFSGF